jgi:hypothetical protein
MGEIVYELDGDGKKLGVIKYVDYSADAVQFILSRIDARNGAFGLIPVY